MRDRCVLSFSRFSTVGSGDKSATQLITAEPEFLVTEVRVYEKFSAMKQFIDGTFLACINHGMSVVPRFVLHSVVVT